MTDLDILKAQLQYAGLTDLPSDDMLNYEILSAKQYINYRRKYTVEPLMPSTPDVSPDFAYLVIPMCKAKILKTGANGQVSHSENGVARGYKTDGEYPLDLILSIPWAAR